MEDIFNKFYSALKHIETLHQTFSDEASYVSGEETDLQFYKHNESLLNEALEELHLSEELYGVDGRQMILADLYEYIFLGRGYYCLDGRSTEDKQLFIKAILRFVNILMVYESATVSDNLRKKFISNLGKNIKDVQKEEYYRELKNFKGSSPGSSTGLDLSRTTGFSFRRGRYWFDTNED